MWQKIKGFLAFIGACILVVFTFGLCRSYFDRRRSNGTSDTDTRVTEGIKTAENRVDRCTDKLTRAEEILRTATERSKKK